MSRKARKLRRRDMEPDMRFGSMLAARFINSLMYEGKKSTAQKIFYTALDSVGEKIKDFQPVDAFHTAIENIKPSVEVKSRRVGGANYQIPVEVAPARRTALAIRWLLIAARSPNCSDCGTPVNWISDSVRQPHSV